MRKHIVYADALVFSWNNDEPARTLCGISRRFDEDSHDERLRLPTCRNCERIAARTSSEPIKEKTAKQIRAGFTTAQWHYEDAILSVQKWEMK